MAVDPAIVTALAELHQHRSIDGACLVMGSALAANHLPFSDATVHALCATVNEMCAGYSAVGRSIDEYYFGYDQGHLTILVRDKVRLILFLKSLEEVDQIAEVGRKFLEQHGKILATTNPGDLTQPIRVRARGDMAGGGRERPFADGPAVS